MYVVFPVSYSYMIVQTVWCTHTRTHTHTHTHAHTHTHTRTHAHTHARTHARTHANTHTHTHTHSSYLITINSDTLPLILHTFISINNELHKLETSNNPHTTEHVKWKKVFERECSCERSVLTWLASYVGWTNMHHCFLSHHCVPWAIIHVDIFCGNLISQSCLRENFCVLIFVNT